MGKVYYDLCAKIWQPTNLWAAYKQAAIGKRAKPYVAEFEYNLEKHLIALEGELRNETYFPGNYENFWIRRPKQRLISAAPFRDRVVHHALMNIIEPLFERQFIHDSYANRIGKGTHKALDRCTFYLRRHQYVMHLDVRRFFPSIDHLILIEILQKTIGDKSVIKLVQKIIASGAGIHAKTSETVYFPGDDLFAVSRPRGLPIGNLTSQHWANVYLNQLDQYAKRVLKIRAYIRYVDDILIFANEKSTLHKWEAAISEYLQGLRLTIHTSRAQPRPVNTGIPFLGFIVFPDHRRLKKRNGIAFQRRLKGLRNRYCAGDIELEDLRASLRGWINHVRYGDTWGLRQSILNKEELGE